MFLSEQEVAMKRPDGSICTFRDRGVQSGPAVTMETPSTSCEETDLDEGSVFTLRAFVELLLFPIADVKDPAEARGVHHWCTHACTYAHTQA